MVLCADMCAVVHFPPVRHLNIYITRQFLGPRLMAPRNAYWFESKLEKRIPLMLNYKKKGMNPEATGKDQIQPRRVDNSTSP